MTLWLWMSGKRNVSVCIGHELENALYLLCMVAWTYWHSMCVRLVYTSAEFHWSSLEDYNMLCICSLVVWILYNRKIVTLTYLHLKMSKKTCTIINCTKQNFPVYPRHLVSPCVVIIYNYIFLPLVLTLLSDNLVPLSPSPLVTICLPYRIDYWLSNGCHVAHASPLPSYYLFALPYWLSIIQRLSCSSRSRVLYKPWTFLIIITLRRCSTVKRTIPSLPFLSGIELLVAILRGIQVTNIAYKTHTTILYK